jgi:CHAD domain-containing protein
MDRWAGGVATSLVMTTAAARQLAGIAKELVRAGKKARRRGKPKDWHRLRTTSRRLRGALAAFAAALDPAVQPQLARRAKKITKLPAKVRDLDVAIGNLALLRGQAETRGERRAAREMIRRLRGKRDENERALRKRLARKRPVHRLARRLKKALRHPVAPGRPTDSSAALGRAGRVVLERHAALGGWEDDDKLHTLRVAVKQYRGALAAWVDAHPGSAREHRPALEALQKVQTVLGEHHDWSELARRLDIRRLALANDGAGHRDLLGYEGLLGRARREQKERFEGYRAQFHDHLPGLVSHEAAALAAARARASGLRQLFEMAAVN